MARAKEQHFIPRILHSEMHTIAVISPLCKKGGSCIRESDQYNLNLVEGEDSKRGLISPPHFLSSSSSSSFLSTCLNAGS